MRNESLEDWLPLRGRWLRLLLGVVGWSCRIVFFWLCLYVFAAAVFPFHPFQNRQSKRAQVATAKAQINAFRTALELYRLDNGRVPTTSQGLAALCVLRNIPPQPWKWAGPYLRDCQSVPLDPWGNSYYYHTLGRSGNLCLIVCYGSDGVLGGTGDAADLTCNVTFSTGKLGEGPAE